MGAGARDEQDSRTGLAIRRSPNTPTSSFSMTICRFPAEPPTSPVPSNWRKRSAPTSSSRRWRTIYYTWEAHMSFPDAVCHATNFGRNHDARLFERGFPRLRAASATRACSMSGPDGPIEPIVSKLGEALLGPTAAVLRPRRGRRDAHTAGVERLAAACHRQGRGVLAHAVLRRQRCASLRASRIAKRPPVSNFPASTRLRTEQATDRARCAGKKSARPRRVYQAKRAVPLDAPPSPPESRGLAHAGWSVVG